MLPSERRGQALIGGQRFPKRCLKRACHSSRQRDVGLYRPTPAQLYLKACIPNTTPPVEQPRRRKANKTRKSPVPRDLDVSMCRRTEKQNHGSCEKRITSGIRNRKATWSHTDDFVGMTGFDFPHVRCCKVFGCCVQEQHRTSIKHDMTSISPWRRVHDVSSMHYFIYQHHQ